MVTRRGPKRDELEIRELRWISLLWLDFVITGPFIINKSTQMSIVFHYQYIGHLPYTKKQLMGELHPSPYLIHLIQSGDIPDLVTGDRTLISNERRSRLF